MRAILFALLVSGLMSGCTQTEYIRVPVEVKVPVAVPCIEEIEPPREYATSKLTKKSPDGEIVRAMFIEIEERSAVEVYLRAILSGCVSG